MKYLEYLIPIFIYLYLNLCLYLITKQLAPKIALLAWIPIINIIIMVKISERSYWNLLFLIIPIFNIITIVKIWGSISEELYHPTWYGILILVPGFNIFIISILAFSEKRENEIYKKMMKSNKKSNSM